MKKNRILTLLLAVAMLLVSCDRGGGNIVPEQQESTLILNSLAVVEVAAEGGEVEILYTVNNPVSGATIEVSHPEWVESYEVSEVITLNVSANNDSKAREGVVTVSYLTKSFDVTLIQTYNNSEEPNPEEVNFEASILTGEYYGEYYTPGHGNYFIFFTDNGFNADGYYLPNSTYYQLDLYAPLREGEFTGVVEIPDGVYELDLEDTLAEGTFSAAYSAYIVTDDEDSSKMSFSSGRLVVENGSYQLDVVIDGVEHHVTYSGESHITDQTDEIVPPEVTEVEVVAHWGVYYGERYSPGMGNYYLMLSPDGWDDAGNELPNGRYYRLDLYAPLCEGDLTNGVAIPVGEYTLDLASSCAAYTIAYGNYTAYMEMNDTASGYIQEQVINGCKVVVTESGITAEVSFEGARHLLTYNNSQILLDDYSDATGGGGSGSMSNLESDVVCDFSDHMVMYRGYGDYYGNGTTNWTVLIAPNSSVGDAVQFDLLTSGEQTDDFTGSFRCASDYSANTFLGGNVSDGYLNFSWYYSSDDVGALINYAPLLDGELSVVHNDDGTTTISFDCYDDLGNRITGSWTGDELVEV